MLYIAIMKEGIHMQNQNKFNELIQNEDFVKKIIQLDKVEDVQKEFKANGVEVTLDEIEQLGDLIAAEETKSLTPEELDNITGGLFSDAVAAGAMIGGSGLVSIAAAATVAAANCAIKAITVVGMTNLGLWVYKKIRATIREEKIKDLANKNILPSTLDDSSWLIRMMGNDAAHADDINYTDYEVGQIIEFVEMIITYLYELPNRIDDLKEARERRLKRK